VTPIAPRVEGHQPRNYEGLINPVPEVLERPGKFFSALRHTMTSRTKFYNHMPAREVKQRRSRGRLERLLQILRGSKSVGQSFVSLPHARGARRRRAFARRVSRSRDDFPLMVSGTWIVRGAKSSSIELFAMKTCWWSWVKYSHSSTFLLTGPLVSHKRNRYIAPTGGHIRKCSHEPTTANRRESIRQRNRTATVIDLSRNLETNSRRLNRRLLFDRSFVCMVICPLRNIR